MHLLANIDGCKYNHCTRSTASPMKGGQIIRKMKSRLLWILSYIGIKGFHIPIFIKKMIGFNAQNLKINKTRISFAAHRTFFGLFALIFLVLKFLRC